MWGFGRESREAETAEAVALPLDRLIGLRAEAARIDSRSLRAITQLSGETRTRRRGQGLEFDDLRLYAPGDDLRRIDWKATARTGAPHTRMYREERQRGATVVVDLRASMFTGSRRLRAVTAGEAGAALLWGLAAARDRTAAAVFTDLDLEVSPARNGEQGALAGVHLLAEGFALGLRRRAEKPPARPLAEVFGRMLNRAGRGFGVFVLVTGMDDPGEGFEAALGEAGERGRLAAVLIEDPVEREGLESGLYRFKTPEGEERVARLDSRARALLREKLAARGEALRTALRRAGTPFVAPETPQEVYAALVAQGAL